MVRGTPRSSPATPNIRLRVKSFHMWISAWENGRSQGRSASRLQGTMPSAKCVSSLAGLVTRFGRDSRNSGTMTGLPRRCKRGGVHIVAISSKQAGTPDLEARKQHIQSISATCNSTCTPLRRIEIHRRVKYQTCCSLFFSRALLFCRVLEGPVLKPAGKTRG